MRSLTATLGLIGLLGCAHLPRASTEAEEVYFITETFCEGEKIVDYKRAESLRKKYPQGKLLVLSPDTALPEVEGNYNGGIVALSGFYEGEKINRNLLLTKVNEVVPRGSLIFLMSHGDPKLNLPNMEVCPWNGWQEVRKSSPGEVDVRIKQDGAYLTEKDFPGSRVYPLNCSAHPQYILEEELDRVAEDILKFGTEAPYIDKTLKDTYVTDRAFLEEK